MDCTGLNKVKNYMQAMRGWAARCAPWVGLLGLLGSGQQATAGDYDGSPQVAEFVAQMTRDYGFADEQLMDPRRHFPSGRAGKALEGLSPDVPHRRPGRPWR
jgi:membrane-bound lytic murein transglycosylase B